MARAIWKGVVIAESENCQIVEGNYYFPPDSIKWEYFIPSDTQTVCSWKGVANYYTITVNGEENKDAAWYYPNPKERAQHIKNYIAFWRGVVIEK
ncbi:MAG: DUF427 domain-containing protein [Geminocystis sp.]|nr:DUF427 domain-containing protein [Geminocystis sp.]HIK37432.1 DUF427 domain-containing protein [Geminocystis sp. M7585_C2015_104]MCS7148845.1 DUF427 domain-containing protein [Geminocystis sp.]MCX8077402.1 DUF427 domain-containing protein [Geminocystis sp.]MDW8115929.1 DUF427 domain-containing protein [Geminocystis sp.]